MSEKKDFHLSITRRNFVYKPKDVKEGKMSVEIKKFIKTEN